MAETEFLIASGWDADYEDLLPLSDATLRIKPPRQEEIIPDRQSQGQLIEIHADGGE